MYLLFVPPLEFVFVSNFILSVYLCLCTIFVYSAILGKPYKSTVISNNNNNNNNNNIHCGGLRLVLYSHVKHSAHVQLHMALHVACFFFYTITWSG